MRPLRLGVRALVGLLALHLAPGLLLAQAAPSMRVSDPAAWASGSPYVAQSGSTLHIAGVAAAASGVRAVQVNGVPARLRLDPQAPGEVRFELDLPVTASLTSVAIVVQPGAGSALERRYRVHVLPPVAGGPTGSAAQIPELPPIKALPPPGSPWPGFAVRGAVYAAAAGAGLYLVTRKTVVHNELCTGPPGQQDCVDRTEVRHTGAGPGMALAGAAVAAALLDAALTAHRAHALSAAAAPVPTRTGLLLPSLEPDAHGARIALLRLRF